MRIQYLNLALGLALSCACWGDVTSSLNRVEGLAQTTGDGAGAIASVNSLATDAGIKAFEAGGNAIDAAAAVAFTLGVVDSPNSGIGGGCFILVRWADGRIEAIDGREMAPIKATGDMFLVKGRAEPSLSKTGALAIGVPGSVAALEYLVKKGGKRQWKEPLLAAAKLAEDGFTLDDLYAARLARTAPKLAQFPASAKVFLKKDGSGLSSGDVLKQSDLAATYRKLAANGSDYFYRGEFAQKVGHWMQQNAGIVTAKDFAGYQLLKRKPVESTFRGYTIVGFPPPSSGGTHVAQILNMLESYPLKTMTEADRYHYTIESMKRAFADRAYWLGDADFADVPRGLLDKGYAKSLATGINPLKASKVAGHGTPPAAATNLFNRHTTHIAVADKEGNWVAITTTLNTGFGSKVTIPGTGVLMNNQMDDFAVQAGSANAFGLLGDQANRVEAAKRPLSSMSPTLVLKENKPVMTLGAAGGPTIINQVVQVLINKLALDMNAEDALEAPRVHQQWTPETTYIDAYVSASLRKKLEGRGHKIANWPSFGATQLIVLEEGKLVPIAEPRLKTRM